MKEIAHHIVKTSILFVTAFLLAVSGANAEISQWQDLGGGRARLVSVLDPESGLIEGVFDVELKPGWTTYWRNPGESGIPPTFDFSTSTGISVEQPSFPVPHSKNIGGIVSVGYHDHVAFPFVATPLITPLSGELKLEVLIGVCEAICIPAIANFSINIDQLNKSDPFSQQMITAAKMKIPVKSSDQVATNDEYPKILSAKKSSDSVITIHVTVPPSAAKPELFAEGKATWFFNPAKMIKREGASAIFELSLVDLPKGADLSETPVRMTLGAGDRGSERSFLIEK